VFARPWIQLALGIVCMASVANMQYGWTLFVDPIDAQYHWGCAAIQVAFTVFVGWVSDHIGRENTTAIAFLVGAASLFVVSEAGTHPATFVLTTGLYFGVFGEIYSLFPATQGDTFGAKYAAANAGMLYTAKGAGSLVVSFATALGAARGWNTVFALVMTGNVVAALLGLFVLKPMRARHFDAVRAEAASPTAVSAPTQRAAGS
jgi:MFS transporter, OFA family, oxalate/formate antiporter